MENLARYLLRASFSQERMTYFPEPVVSLKVERESQITCRSKDNRQEKTFAALEWLVPYPSREGTNSSELRFLYNVSLGLRQKENMEALIPLQSMELLYEPPHS